MTQHNVVREVVVTQSAERHKAVYFVENGIIHANIEGRILLTPLANCRPEDTVRALMTEHLLHRSIAMQRSASRRQ